VHYFMTITIFTILSLILYLQFTIAKVKLSAGQHFLWDVIVNCCSELSYEYLLTYNYVLTLVLTLVLSYDPLYSITRETGSNKLRQLTTIHPVRRNMTTLKMLIMHDVNTPSQVPNNTGSEMKKFAFHHGLLSDDCRPQLTGPCAMKC